MSEQFSYDGADLEAAADLPNYQQAIFDYFGSCVRGRGIELGAGLGNMSAMYVDKIDEAVLVEPASNLHARLGERFADNPSVQTHSAFIEDLVKPEQPVLQPRSFDFAVSINVLEHIEDDVAALSILRSLVKPGGYVLTFVPALPAIFGTLDELVDHFRRYTRTSLMALHADAGLDVEKMKYFDFPGIFAWYAAGRIFKQRAHNENAAKTYDRFIVPLSRLVEDRISPPIGKNLVSVARVPMTPDA